MLMILFLLVPPSLPYYSCPLSLNCNCCHCLLFQCLTVSPFVPFLAWEFSSFLRISNMTISLFLCYFSAPCAVISLYIAVLGLICSSILLCFFLFHFCFSPCCLVRFPGFPVPGLHAFWALALPSAAHLSNSLCSCR